MTALLKLIPLKDWIYLAILILLGCGFWYYTVHERKIGAAHEIAAVTKASDATKRQAQATIDTNAAQYAANLKASQEKRDADVNAAAAHAADLGERLRYYETHNGGNPVLQGPTAPGTPAAACSGSDSEVVVPRAIYEGLINVEAATEHDQPIIVSERSERDSLTGK